MTFLPIVDRELRVAARRKALSRVRWWSALVAFVMTFTSLLALSLSSNRPVGKPLFSLLTAYTFGLCALAGVFLTADALSEEKREGTLGLLFLTDLKGYDVVLGKFLARSLDAFYALLALLPITGIPLLMGGVTGGEFWRTALALTHALFFSLASGILVSAWARDRRTAIGAGFAFSLIAFGGLPLLSDFLQSTRLAGLARAIESTGPFYPFYYAAESVYVTRAGAYWGALFCSNLIAWLFLGCASVLLPRNWQETGRAPVARFARLWRGPAQREARQRERLLQINPVYWLLLREGSLRWLSWLVVAIWGAVLCFWSSTSMTSSRGGNPLFFYYQAKGCAFVLKILVALQACRFFAEARSSGAIEVLLATPLRNREIIRAQWMSLRTFFVWPLVGFALCNLIPAMISLYTVWWLAAPGQRWSAAQKFFELGMSGLVVVWLMFCTVVDVLAVSYVGTWLALSMKKPALAPGATILVVLILPSAGFLCGLDLLVDLFLILWASSKLAQDLRWTISKPYQQRLPIPSRAFSAGSRYPPRISAGNAR